MSTDATTQSAGRPAEPAKGATPDEIERDIERTRAELGQTVDALAAKADLKTRAQHRAKQLREERPQALYGAGAGAVLVLSVLGVALWRRRR